LSERYKKKKKEYIRILYLNLQVYGVAKERQRKEGKFGTSPRRLVDQIRSRKTINLRETLMRKKEEEPGEPHGTSRT